MESFLAFVHLSTNEGTKSTRDIQWPNMSKFTAFSQNLGQGIQPRHFFHLWSCREIFSHGPQGETPWERRLYYAEEKKRWKVSQVKPCFTCGLVWLLMLCGYEGAFPCNVNPGISKNLYLPLPEGADGLSKKQFPQVVGLKGIWKGNETPITHLEHESW